MRKIRIDATRATTLNPLAAELLPLSNEKEKGVLSDHVLMELVRDSPLRENLLREAWPSLAVESKLEIVDAVARPDNAIPEYLVDLALSDHAPIVRFWGARFYYFHKQRDDEQSRQEGLPPNLRTRPEQFQLAARAEGDQSQLVRAATNAQRGIGLSDLIDLPQLERLIKIRALDFPATEDFAKFVEKAVEKGAPVKDVQHCLREYFGRSDVRDEVLEMDADGGAEFSKRRGWEKLWTIAATAPIEVGRLIGYEARLQGKLWEIDLEKLLALPDKIKEAVAWREDEPAEKLRAVVIASPEKYDKGVVDAVRRFGEFRADYGGRSEQEKAKLRFESMPNRQDAIFDAVGDLREQLEQQSEAITALAKRADLAAATQKITNWVTWAVAIGVVILYSLIRH